MTQKRYPATGLLAEIAKTGMRGKEFAKQMNRSQPGIGNWKNHPNENQMPEADIIRAAVVLKTTPQAIAPTYPVAKNAPAQISTTLDTERMIVYGLKAAREKVPMSGKTMQLLIEVSDSTYYEYENLKSRMPISKIHRCAAILGVSFEELTKSNNAPNESTKDEIVSLLNRLNSLVANL